MPREEEDFGMNGWPRMPKKSIDLNLLDLQKHLKSTTLFANVYCKKAPFQAKKKQYSKDGFCLVQA